MVKILNKIIKYQLPIHIIFMQKSRDKKAKIFHSYFQFYNSTLKHLFTKQKTERRKWSTRIL